MSWNEPFGDSRIKESTCWMVCKAPNKGKHQLDGIRLISFLTPAYRSSKKTPEWLGGFGEKKKDRTPTWPWVASPLASHFGVDEHPFDFHLCSCTGFLTHTNLDSWFFTYFLGFPWVPSQEKLDQGIGRSTYQNQVPGVSMTWAMTQCLKGHGDSRWKVTCINQKGRVPFAYGSFKVAGSEDFVCSHGLKKT